MKAALSFENAYAPVKGLNDIALDYAAKVVDINMGVLRKQADAMLAGWREAASVKDAEGLKSYVAHQSEVARILVEEYVADTKTVGEYGLRAAESARKVVEESIPLEPSKAV